MWLFDERTTRFVQVNKAALKLYGYSEAEFLSMRLVDIKINEDAPTLKGELAKAKVVPGIYNEVYRHKKKSGEIMIVEVYSNPITLNGRHLRSTIAIDVTEKNQLEQKVIKAIIQTQEDERYEIGGELHDNVCQILAASMIHLGVLKKSLSPAAGSLLEQSMEYITLASVEIRNLSHRLAPVFFEESTMEEAFKKLCSTFNTEDLDILLDFDSSLKKVTLNRDIQLNFYRILQEQLRNILKYAEATQVEVEVLIFKEKLKMRISDNGIGFDTATAKDGIGLANMKRRTELFCGKFEIESAPGKGCTIAITIPL
jgi:PAS domain S-box-containing protein